MKASLRGTSVSADSVSKHQHFGSVTIWRMQTVVTCRLSAQTMIMSGETSHNTKSEIPEIFASTEAELGRINGINESSIINVYQKTVLEICHET